LFSVVGCYEFFRHANLSAGAPTGFSLTAAGGSTLRRKPVADIQEMKR
jgi:hypothetical protein